MIVTINKPTRVTRKAVTSVDHILTNYLTETVFKTVIFKSDLSNHFPTFFLVPSFWTQMESKATFIYKRVFDTESIESFKKKLSETDSQETESYENSDEAYAIFLQ